MRRARAPRTGARAGHVRAARWRGPVAVKRRPVQRGAAVRRRRIQCVSARREQFLHDVGVPLRRRVDEGRAPEVVGLVRVRLLLEQRHHRALAPLVRSQQQVAPALELALAHPAGLRRRIPRHPTPAHPSAELARPGFDSGDVTSVMDVTVPRREECRLAWCWSSSGAR